jgi:hypothetical protein
LPEALLKLPAETLTAAENGGSIKMTTVKVYRYKCYDVTHEFAPPPSDPVWGTLAAIDSLHRCVPIVESECEVDEMLLDAQGFLTGEPPDSGS